MRILFVGGPKDGTTMEVSPLMPTLLVPLPRPVSMTPMNQGTDLNLPVTKAAEYEFTHQGIVNIQGQVEAVIYVFKGTT